MIREWGGYASDYFQKKHDLLGSIAKLQPVINSLRQALAQPEQEPVAFRQSNGIIEPVYGVIIPIGASLYAAPPKRELVGLTPDEICQIWISIEPKTSAQFSRALKDKIKEKNT